MDASVAPPIHTSFVSGARANSRSGSPAEPSLPRGRLLQPSDDIGVVFDQHHVEKRGNGVPYGHPVPFAEALGPMRGFAVSGLFGQNQSRAGGERPEDIVLDRSKLNADRPKTRSPSVTPKRRLTSRTVLSAPRWSITTPLGFPVEPDV